MAAPRPLRIALAALIGGLVAALLVTCGPRFGVVGDHARDQRYFETCVLQLAAAERGISNEALDACIHDRQWQRRRACPRHPRGYHRQAQRVAVGGAR